MKHKHTLLKYCLVYIFLTIQNLTDENQPTHVCGMRVCVHSHYWNNRQWPPPHPTWGENQIVKIKIIVSFHYAVGFCFKPWEYLPAGRFPSQTRSSGQQCKDTHLTGEEEQTATNACLIFCYCLPFYVVGPFCPSVFIL